MGFDRYQVAKEKLEKAQNGNSQGVLMAFTVNTLEDQRVCSDCLKFEGYTANVSEAVIGKNHPPFHDDCRCFATYSIEGIRKQEPKTKEIPVKEVDMQTKEEPRKKSLAMLIKEKFKR
ncbi:phage minor head protein [Bacillus sp. FJAT-29937]|uniref:phage minor head protein n=1 Tax=Bacillus sp. FJAT-29937 TaxID=1720553 RepID=UPI000836FFC6|nr:phage minor head protein [Bacillus sp. FJAT-29937]